MDPQRDPEIGVGPDLVVDRHRPGVGSPARGARRGCGPAARCRSDRARSWAVARPTPRTRPRRSAVEPAHGTAAAVQLVERGGSGIAKLVALDGVTSARRLRSMRAARCSSRSVTSPTVWGSRAHSSNAAPPLKSISTRFSSVGGSVAARPATSVRSSSLLPEPVVPATSACGPSATRSTMTGPARLTPRGVAARRSGSAQRRRIAVGGRGLQRQLLDELGRGRRRPVPPGP